uniref:Fungal lipase-like domain-containing protein n=1 Tax=Panagrolaimus sp. ES5 TaxID=591445 RepID=A0AC34F2J2_9BILA
MMPMAAAAYSDSPSLCIQSVFSNASLFRQLTIDCDVFGDDHCSGFTALSHSDQAIIVSFRGTKGFIKLVTESVEAVFTKKVTFLTGGQVSDYFFEGFHNVWSNGMKDDISTLKNRYPSYDIWVVGHSLGGAMASLAAATIVKSGVKPASNVYLYTFGQPRTGDKAFAHAHDALGMTQYRITHHRDIVAHFPPKNFEGYYHHEAEVWYTNKMRVGDNFIECDNDDESNDCSDSEFITLSVDDNAHYFERDVSEYGGDGCVEFFQANKKSKNIKLNN